MQNSLVIKINDLANSIDYQVGYGNALTINALFGALRVWIFPKHTLSAPHFFFLLNLDIHVIVSLPLMIVKKNGFLMSKNEQIHYTMKTTSYITINFYI